jgi:hypothetical protein
MGETEGQPQGGGGGWGWLALSGKLLRSYFLAISTCSVDTGP